MRHLILSTTLLITLPSAAQLINQSFEQTGGWDFTCQGAGWFAADGAAYGGNTCAAITLLSTTQPDCYYTDGIEPYLFQELPSIQNGDFVQVGFNAKVLPDIAANLNSMTTVCAIGYVDGDGQVQILSSCLGGAGQSMTWVEGSYACTVSGLPVGETAALFFGGHAFNNTNGTLFVDNVRISLPGTGIALRPKVWLDGAFDPALNLMRDDLRAAGLVPLTEPYAALNYPGAAGGETTTPAVLNVIGNNAIVDWVRLELRHASVSYPIPIAVRSALLQRDGDVVAADGVSPVTFNVGPGNYYVILKHRNHLPVMSATALSLTTSPTTLDLRASVTACITLPAPNSDLPRKTVGTTRTLWAGNANTSFNGVIYTGMGNDRDVLLNAIGGVVPTNTFTGYHVADINMDGVVRYTGEDNDRDIILQTIGGIVPTNIRIQQVP